VYGFKVIDIPYIT